MKYQGNAGRPAIVNVAAAADQVARTGYSTNKRRIQTTSASAGCTMSIIFQSPVIVTS